MVSSSSLVFQLIQAITAGHSLRDYCPYKYRRERTYCITFYMLIVKQTAQKYSLPFHPFLQHPTMADPHLPGLNPSEQVGDNPVLEEQNMPQPKQQRKIKCMNLMMLTLAGPL